MKLAIMQPYLFPYIGYFQLINAVDKFVILDDVNYFKKGFINRNNYLINGEKKILTLPLKDASQNKLIMETEVLSDLSAKEKFLKTLEVSYKKAPCFTDVFPLIYKIIMHNESNLSAYLYNSIININNYLSIDTEIVKTSSVYNTHHLKGQFKILDICVQEKATTYINPIGGTQLYNKENFAEKSMNMYFLKIGNINYTQYKNEFIPFLSIVDVMMFNSISALKEHLANYTLE